MKQKILVTGAAGFIGFHLVNELLENNCEVVGLDNINDYYSVDLKYDRLKESGILRNDIMWNKMVKSIKFPNYQFIRMKLDEKQEIMNLCSVEQFDVVINLAAQAGVRYSLEHPDVYIESNIIGFYNILEACRYNMVKHLIYASSSSVYGMNKEMPFSVGQNVDHPVSLYAATKRSNELMAEAYSHLYKIPMTGLRFFTVYGPWGRPDMAYFLFAEAIRKGEAIEVFNHGNMQRDFTYITDIVKGIINIIPVPPTARQGMDNVAAHNIYNIGNNQPVHLMEFINILGQNLGSKPEMIMRDMQPGDVPATWADVDDLVAKFDYKPNTDIAYGLAKFIEWYRGYYSY